MNDAPFELGNNLRQMEECVSSGVIPLEMRMSTKN